MINIVYYLVKKQTCSQNTISLMEWSRYKDTENKSPYFFCSIYLSLRTNMREDMWYYFRLVKGEGWNVVQLFHGLHDGAVSPARDRLIIL